MKIHHILKEKGATLYWISPEHTLQAAVNTLVEHNIGSLLVMRGQEVAGIVTERDVLRACARDGARLGDIPVSDVMTKELAICKLDDDVDDAMATMTKKHIRHLPVMNEGRVAGIISIGDIVKSQLKNYEHEIQYLRDYITGASM